MKKQFFTLLLLIISSQCVAQSLLEQVNALIDNKKYKSAFDLLHTEDPENASPELVLKKCEILEQYYVQSLSHQMFSLLDIETSETIESYRINEGNKTYEILMFPIQEILTALIEKHPENYDLHKALGVFYYEVSLRYPNNWIMSFNEIQENIYKYSIHAIEHEKADYMTYFSIGTYFQSKQDYVNSLEFFKKSYQLNNTYPQSCYNLSVCYYQLEDLDNCLPYAIQAYALYSEKPFKADAARLAALVYMKKGEYSSAEKYYLEGYEINPENTDILAERLSLAFIQKDAEKIQKATDQLYAFDPRNSQLMNYILSSYLNAEKGADFENFCTQKLTSSKDAVAKGNLYVYLGYYYREKENKKEAKKAFNNAINSFKVDIDKDNILFEQLENLIKDL